MTRVSFVYPANANSVSIGIYLDTERRNMSDKARKRMHYNELKLKPKLVDEKIGSRNCKKRERSQVETKFSTGRSDDEMEFMENSNIRM